MGRGRTERFVVGVAAGSDVRRRPDDLIVEEPMSIQLDGVLVSTTMRTPGHDFELAVGFCHSEGHLVDGSGRAVPVDGVRYCGTGSAVATEFNVVTVETGGRAVTPIPRLSATSSSCGWCGSDQLDEMLDRFDPIPDHPPVPLPVVHGLSAAVADHQTLFARTGAVHAAAVFSPDGTIGLVREDVGRHNAVDKIIGATVLAGELPTPGTGLFVSSRASVEMVHKAWSAGFSTLVAVSAPTALAVATARRAGMTLIGFTRSDSCNVYSPERPPTSVT